MSKHDLNLLRPLTLDDIKPGTLITWVGNINFGETGEIVYGPAGKKQDFVVNWKEDRLVIHRPGSDYPRLTPLTWVEDKPVYPGDVLWYKRFKGCKATAIGPHTYCESGGIEYLDGNDGKKYSADAAAFTWTPPKTKHQVWLNLYPDGSCGVYSTEEHANARVVSPQTVRRLIEWES